MAFSRKLLPSNDVLDEQTLLSNLVGIGMNLMSKPAKDPNIEDAVLAASIEGMDNNDLRILSIVTMWIEVHCAVLNVDRLGQIIASHTSERVRAYWTAVAMWQRKDRRFTKMISFYDGPVIDLLPVGTDFQIKRHGEDKRFIGSPLRVAANTLRIRESDVLTPSQLAQLHSVYFWRTIIGPVYKADMWAELEKNAKLSTAELARLAYGSFATAWKVKRDWAVVRAHA